MTDDFQVGQLVIARFTNSNQILQFQGEIVGKTKNYWKVKSVTSPYQEEKPGRVFRVATIQARQYSNNNRILKVVD